jgi:shikimate kinase
VPEPIGDPGGPEPDGPYRRILLVGFMGSGKSTVGARLAERLGWGFADLDSAIEEAEGRSIPQIFAEEGEEAFRRIEHGLALALLQGDRLVLASGGGWPCREGRMEGLGPDTLTVWLRVSPERALERVRGQDVRRPLLEVGNPLDTARELLARREPYYGKALWWVDTEVHPPGEVVRLLAERLRTEPERPLRA